jgi:hypothetical protein
MLGLNVASPRNTVAYAPNELLCFSSDTLQKQLWFVDVLRWHFSTGYRIMILSIIDFQLNAPPQLLPWPAVQP